jgi:hypothetical protein
VRARTRRTTIDEVFWETVSTGPRSRRLLGGFAEIWRAAEKIGYSRTLQEVSSART